MNAKVENIKGYFILYCNVFLCVFTTSALIIVLLGFFPLLLCLSLHQFSWLELVWLYSSLFLLYLVLQDSFG